MFCSAAHQRLACYRMFYRPELLFMHRRFHRQRISVYTLHPQRPHVLVDQHSGKSDVVCGDGRQTELGVCERGRMSVSSERGRRRLWTLVRRMSRMFLLLPLLLMLPFCVINETRHLCIRSDAVRPCATDCAHRMEVALDELRQAEISELLIGKEEQ